jgi:outer membrane receptor protein involved in Fe transport
MQLKHYLIFGLLLFLSSLSAQYRLQGSVIDEHNAPIPFALVSLRLTTDSSQVSHQYTSENGSFEFKDQMQGQYQLQIRYVSHRTAEQIIIFESNQPDQNLQPIVLAELSNELDEVQVSTQRSLVQQQADRIVVNVQQLALTAGGSALELISQMPNVMVDRQNNILSMNGKSGLIVAINGKPSRMDEAALVQWLAGQPAANIEKIELIHTPPASYDAAGNAGVLNIILKRRDDEGWGGNIRANFGYGEKAKYGTAANFYWNLPRVRFFADLASNANHTREDLNSFLSVNTGEVFNRSQIESFRPAYRAFHSVRAGAAFDITTKTTLNFTLAGNLSIWNLTARTQTESQTSDHKKTNSILIAKETNNWRHWMGNIGFQHNFSKHQMLSADYDYLYYFAKNPTDYLDQSSENGQPMKATEFISRKETPIRVHVMKMDYSYSFSSEWKWETGLKASAFDFINDVAVLNRIGENWVTDARFSSLLQLKELIGAAYTSTNWQPSEKITLNVGLRFEQTQTRLFRADGSALLSRDYGRLFPTLSFSYRPNDVNQWQLAYTERITRPPLYWMAPAFFFFGPGVAVGGNPGIFPAYSRQITTSWKHHAFLLTLQVNRERNTLTYQPKYDSAAEINLFRADNIPKVDVVMVSMNHTIQRGVWSSQANLSVFGQRNRPQYEGKIYDIKDVYLRFSTTQTVKLPWAMSLELSNQTSTPQQYGMGKIPFITLFSAGLQKQFGQSNQLTFHVFDLFDLGSFYGSNTNLPELVSLFNYQYEGSVFRLTFAHNFGRTIKRKSGDRATASEDERRRVQ